MADQSKEKVDSSLDIFNSPLSKAAKKTLISNMDNSSKNLKRLQNGVDNKTLDLVSDNDDLMSNINGKVNQVFSSITNTGNVSDLGSEVIDKMILMSKKHTDVENIKKKGKTKKIDDELENLKNSVTESNTDNLEQLMSMHKSKTMDSIATYNLIVKIIPKMRLLLNTYATSILSPDDLTSSKVNISLTEENLDQDEKNKILKKASVLFDKYDINKNIRNDIISYLITGKLFYLVTSVNEELIKMLNEEQNLTGEGMYRSLSESTSFATLFENDLSESIKHDNHKPNLLIEEFKDTFKIRDKSDKELSECAKNVDSVLNDTFIIADSSALLNDLSEDCLSEDTIISNLQSNFSGGKSKKVTNKDVKGTNKAIVKKISPSNIIPLEHDRKTYGYIHLDIIEIDPDGDVMPVDSSTDEEGFGMSPSASTISGAGNAISGIISNTIDIASDRQGGANKIGNKSYENPTQSPGLSSSDDARLLFMANVFTNKLSKETNLKLIKKSETLKNAVYNGLAVKKLNSNQKIRIVYLKPEEVVYINRGHSIFDNVLFFCKIYIATLITILMQNVLNGGEKRAVYVEVGEDNNPANSINRVVKDIRSREMGSVMGMDINSILNVQSQFQSYYIPVVDGEKPISFETIDSLNNKSIDDEFLNWLGGQIYSGMGTPTAYLNEVENVDFAKLLTMQNSRYLRECLTEQLNLSPGFTDLLRKIYYIEYDEYLQDNGEDNSLTSADSDIVTPTLLEVKLPVPSALALYSIGEQLNNAQTVADTIMTNTNIVSIAGVPQEEEERLKSHIRNNVLRSLASSVDWAKMDTIINTAMNEYKETKIKENLNKPDTDDGTGDESGEIY